MNKISATIGILLIAVAAFLFLVTFSGGNFSAFAVTGTSASSNFIALVLVILLLPIGSGPAFFGLAYRRPILATATTPAIYKGSPTTTRVALAVAVISLIMAFAAFAVFYSNLGTQSSNLAGLSSQVTALNGRVANAAFNSDRAAY